MNQIVAGVLAEAALSLFNKFLQSRPWENQSEDQEGYPRTWEEGYDQIVAYAERQDGLNREQSEFVVKLAEQIDAAHNKVDTYEARVNDLMQQNQYLVRRAEIAELSARRIARRFTLSLLLGSLGAVLVLVAILAVYLRGS
jgi:hypothetical protein